MSSSLVLVLAVAVAYLAARVAFDWLARRFLIVSGAEYLLLGVLLGPQVSGLLSADVMAGFTPLTTLALGWIGAIVGMQFHLPLLVRIEGQKYRLAFFEALAALALVAGAMALGIRFFYGLSWTDAVMPAIALGAIAAVSAPAGIQVVARRLGRSAVVVVRQLEVATAIDALVGIVTFGFLVAIRRPIDIANGPAITSTEWVVISLGIGVIGGTLFHLFVGNETHADRLFISLAGAVILASGAAAYLGLSPLLASMVVGIVLVNTSPRNRAQLAATLSHAERPFYFVLLVFAGATWRPALGGWWGLLVLLFLVTRVVAKTGGAWLGARVNGALAEVGPHWGRGLLGQGGLAVALALDYMGTDGAPLQSLVFTSAFASVLLTDVGQARFIQSAVGSLLVGRARRGDADAAAALARVTDGGGAAEPAGSGATRRATPASVSGVPPRAAERGGG